MFDSNLVQNDFFYQYGGSTRPRDIILKDMSLWDDPFGAPFGGGSSPSGIYPLVLN